MADPAHQAQANTQLLTKFTAILRNPADFTDKDVLPPMRGPPMTIRLMDDAQPFFSECSLSDALRVVCLRGRSLLQRMVQQGIIDRAPHVWRTV